MVQGQPGHIVRSCLASKHNAPSLSPNYSLCPPKSETLEILLLNENKTQTQLGNIALVLVHAVRVMQV
jgi:hypothetical protein